MLKRLANKNLHTWLGGYGRALASRARTRIAGSSPGKRHLLFAICDHYEPLWGKETPAQRGLTRVQEWRNRYPQVTRSFRDVDDHPPRHSFFFPGEEYAPEYLQPLAELATMGLGEVELHLHHDGDSADGLRGDIERYLRLFREHGHISSDSSGSPQFAFIHGNWCLANARRDGRWCGVDNELEILHELGCYADYTFPSAPDECQPNIVNQIYWPTGDLGRRKAYATGEEAEVGTFRNDRVLMITGPLALTRRPGTRGIRIESSSIDYSDPPSATRVDSWVSQDIHVRGRPEWVFVKVHTHGAPESNAAIMLGPQIAEMHEHLQRHYNDGERWSLHYVTAREMYNIAAAAMDGKAGNPGAFRDYRIAPPAASD